MQGGWRRFGVGCGLAILLAVALSAQTFTSLASFAGSNGSGPLFMSLAQATDGNFYGTTATGGANGWGTIFQMTPSGTLTTLHNFDVTDGEYPYAGLTLATNGNLYGTTLGGGAFYGTIYQITTTGMFTTLHSFSATDGADPYGGVTQGANGNLFGTTFYGGASTACSDGCGTIFSLSPTGTLTTVRNLALKNGSGPASGLTLGADGNFYGTTYDGGTSQACFSGCGTVYKVTPAGALTVLANFDSTNGANPHAALVQDQTGSFYGTTANGGTGSCLPPGCGTVFKVTPAGVLTTLYNFCSQPNCSDGDSPYSPLILATDGNFYGTTVHGGAYYGTIYKITASGTLTVLHNFASSDGAYPYGGLVEGTDGNLYGSTFYGGANYGTVFKLSIGLSPFVELLPVTSPVGAPVSILGTNLSGATSVTFHGTAAIFTIASPTLITTTVPVGATTGKIQVVTPGGTLSSNVAFRVLP